MDTSIGVIPAELPFWRVPATLADFECAHGRLGRCDDCGNEKEEAMTNSERAAEWLRDLLSDGPVETVEVTARARAAGFGDGPICQARRALGVTWKKRGYQGSTWLSLPELPAALLERVAETAGPVAAAEPAPAAGEGCLLCLRRCDGGLCLRLDRGAWERLAAALERC